MADDDKPTGDPPKDDDTGTPPAADPPPVVDDSGGTEDEKLRTIVREELAKLAPSQRTPSRRADLEEAARLAVQDAAERLDTEKELERTKKELEEAKKTVTEEAPKKVRKLTKIMWGSDE